MTYVVDALPVWETSSVVFEIGDVIRKLRRERHWSLDKMAEVSGVNRMSLSEIERGVVDPRRSTIEKVAGAFGLQIDGLYALAKASDPVRHAGTQQSNELEAEHYDADITRGYKKNDVPVVGDAEASIAGLISWDEAGIVRGQVEDWVSRSFADGDPLAYALRVRGDSMVPRYHPGEIVVAQPRLTARDGDYACVQLVTGERLIKRVFRYDGGWILHSENASYPDRRATNEEIAAMHRIKHSIAP